MVPSNENSNDAFDYNYRDVVEPDVMDNGIYELQLATINTNKGTSEKGRDWRSLNLGWKVLGQGDKLVKLCYDTLFAPNAEDKGTDKWNYTMLDFQRLEQALGVDCSEYFTAFFRNEEISFDDLLNQTVKAELKVKTNDKGVKFNVINKYIAKGK